MTHQTICHSNRKEFIRFLKEEGVYAAYKRNFNIEHICAWSTDLYNKIKNDGEDFFDVVCPEEYISGAFKWSHTPEGSVFWCDLHLIWNDKTYGEDLW